MYGIKRKTAGIDGYKAILLWEKYVKKGQLGALKLLLEYNKEDVINLIPLEEIFTRRLEEMKELEKLKEMNEMKQLKELSNDGAV